MPNDNKKAFSVIPGGRMSREAQEMAARFFTRKLVERTFNGGDQPGAPLERFSLVLAEAFELFSTTATVPASDTTIEVFCKDVLELLAEPEENALILRETMIDMIGNGYAVDFERVRALLIAALAALPHQA